MAAGYSSLPTVNGDGNIQQLGEEDHTVKGDTSKRRHLSHLPFLRYTTLATLIIAIDSLLCISLWIAGGNSAYLEQNVEHFSLYKSTFDLACLAAVRGPLLIACIYYLEHYTLVSISTRFRSRQLVSRRLAELFRASFVIIVLISFVYSLIKGVLILLHKESKDQLHITYKILCVVGVVNPTLELLLGLCSFYFMRQLTRLHRLLLNEDESGELATPKKKADLKRLIILARPVRNFKISLFVPLIRNTR